MSTVILKWNPEISSYRMNHFKAAMMEAKETLEYEMNWSVWEYEKVNIGDRFYLVRVGNGNTGIVMSGFVDSMPYKDEDWSGKDRETYYIDLAPDFLINTEKGPHVSTADLQASIPNFKWDKGHSGMFLNEADGTKLEWLWAEFLYKNYTLENGKNFASCGCGIETGKNSVIDHYHYQFYGPLHLDLMREKGMACEICGYDYKKIFDPSILNNDVMGFLYEAYPHKELPKSIKPLFHCICSNCRNIYKDICNNLNKGELVPLEMLKKAKRQDFCEPKDKEIERVS